MKSMLDLTQNRYSSQWSVKKNKSEFYVAPRSLDSALQIWEMGPYDSESDAKKIFLWMQSELKSKVSKFERFAKESIDKEDKKYYEDALKKYKEALQTLKITKY